MRRKAILLAVVLVAAGCGREGAVETTTTPTADVSMTTAPVETATTELVSVAEGAVSIPAGRTELWAAGAAYGTDRFVVPVSFVPVDDGWRSVGVTSNWLHVTWVAGDPREQVGSLTVLSYRSVSGVDEVVAAITSIEGVQVLAGPAVGAVGGVDWVVFDVEGEEQDVVTPQSSDGCSSTTGRFFFDRAGYTLVDDDPHALGIAACKLSRVWVAEVEGMTVTVIGGVDDKDRTDEVLVGIERLLDSMTFEAP